MSYKLNLKKYQKLLREVTYLRNEYEYQQEILNEVHHDFEHYYREWCANNDVDIDGLNKKHSKRVDKLITKPSKREEISPISGEQIETKRKANKFSKLYKKLARELHPDKNEGNAEKFAKVSDAYNNGHWSVLLEAASDMNLLPDNFKEIFPLMREEIDELRKKISNNESMYSWKFFECEENDTCKDELVKQFLRHLFKLEV
jgi:hypothetical protein